ncbi:MAG: type I-U CRISPR-associated protein Csb2 [Acidimicrobiaceae bacterium]|nr:type I-U CRISPR-associated protein Csb2 [Acidimicrobiaceae bacterium]MDE0496431.1 type I-U CRISPR-associated protein Csb2 [Acidimicrobiaceae bacterium]
MAEFGRVMLIATVEFLLGTYRADPDGTAHTGRLERGEWPPAPSRLFDALVAADGTRDQCRHTDGTELEFLERADPPLIDATDDVCHQQLQPRFIVKQGGKSVKGQQQEYVGRASAPVRPGVRVAPRIPTVRYLWQVDADDLQLRSLQLRAARIGYLGCADSPVRVRIERVPDDTAFAPESAFRPAAGDATVPTVALGVPVSGRLAVLDATFDQWLEHGPSFERKQSPALTTKARYVRPRRESIQQSRGRIAAALILRPAVSGRRVAAVAAAFKAAVLQRYTERHQTESPNVLHGHGFGSVGYDLARYLSFPDVGHSRARGRIHAVALWLPPECDETLVHAVRGTVHSIRRLAGPGVNAGAEVWDYQRQPLAAQPRRWTRSSHRWVTVFPAIHERHVKLTLEEVGRWCEHAGLPRPAAFRSSRAPLVGGGVSLTPIEVHRPGKPQRPYSHVELLFDEPVTGPVVIGSGRQRGLGLCVPVDDRPERPVPSQDRE